MGTASGPVALAILAAAGAARAEDAPAFKLVRADEDYAYLRTVQERTGFDRLRYIPLGDEAYLSLGGEARWRVDASSAPRFGLGREAADTFALGRLLVSGDLHVAPTLRVYGELGLHRDLGKRAAPALTDRDALDAQVLFVDLTPAPGWRLRLGRQELLLNPTQRFVAVREGPNIRQNFDGVRVTRTVGRLKLDAFHLQPVVLSPGVFDDRRSRSQRFYGLYAATRLSPQVSLDTYVLSLERDGARFGSITGDERRVSLGARLAGSAGPLDYEAEGVAQGGRFAGRRIRAFAASAGGGYTLEHPWRPRLGLRLDFGSGDSDPTDQRLETFNPMFPKGAYFNEAGLTSWGNLTALRASLGVTPARAVGLETSYTSYRCRTRADAIYLQPLTPLVTRCDGPSKNLGGAAQLDGTWQVNRNLKLQGQLVRQTAGQALEIQGGKAVTFATLVAQLRF